MAFSGVFALYLKTLEPMLLTLGVRLANAVEHVHLVMESLMRFIDTHLNQMVQGKRIAAYWIKPPYFCHTSRDSLIDLKQIIAKAV